MTKKTSLPDNDSSLPARGLSTQAVHAGEDRQKPGHSMTDPIFCTATYTFANTQAAVDFVAQK
jgi:cystathionine gamma-synthase